MDDAPSIRPRVTEMKDHGNASGARADKPSEHMQLKYNEGFVKTVCPSRMENHFMQRHVGKAGGHNTHSQAKVKKAAQTMKNIFRPSSASGKS
jgi:hypothetical protein